jgi:hypothetical protein
LSTSGVKQLQFHGELKISGYHNQIQRKCFAKKKKNGNVNLEKGKVSLTPTAAVSRKERLISRETPRVVRPLEKNTADPQLVGEHRRDAAAEVPRGAL